MIPLFDRGREALLAYIEALPSRLYRKESLLVAARNLDVVTHADFVANAELVLRHVVHNGVCTHVLNLDGSLVAVVEKRTFNW